MSMHRCPVPADLICLTRVCVLATVGLAGCSVGGYSNRSLYPTEVRTVCVEMFDNRTFRRDIEYTLSDALAKRVEAQSPYKIVSDQDRADTVLGGQIVSATEAVLSLERASGRPAEKEVQITAVVHWKNLKTGQLLLDSRTVTAAASYSPYMDQGFGYACDLAANRLAEKIVELMEVSW